MTRTSTARSNPASRAAAARLRLLALCGVTALALAACGGGGGSHEPSPPPQPRPAGTALVGSGGGQVSGVGGASVVVPPGALAARPDNPMFRQSLNLPAAPAAGTVAPPRRVGPAVREGMAPGARPTDARLTTAPF